MITITKENSLYKSEYNNKVFFIFLDNAFNKKEENAILSIIVACVLGRGISKSRLPSNNEINKAEDKAKEIMNNKGFELIIDNSDQDKSKTNILPGFFTRLAFEK